MGKPKAPAPPDPRAQARATLGSNVATARANNWMQMMDQTGPFGATSHNEVGTTSITDPYSGAVINVPRYASNTRLSENEKAVYEASTKNRIGAAGATGRAIQSWHDALDNWDMPDSITADALQTRADQIAGPKFEGDYMHRIRGDLDRRRAAREADLDARGVTMGSEAWDNAQETLFRAENDAAIEASLRGRTQDWAERSGARRLAWSEMAGTFDRDLAAAELPRATALREIGALSGLSPVNAPGTQPVLPGGFSGIDASALEQMAYQNRENVYKRKMQSWDDMFATLGGVGQAYAGAA